jgi:calcineurin-like phosphoesterase family protein
MAYYFTADTHFGHSNIIRYCKRPFLGSDQMTEELIKNWNEMVTPKDTVFHLGDFCLEETEFDEFASRLNGKLILIQGNHDSRKRSIMVDGMIEYGGKFWEMVHRPEDATEPYVLCGHIHDKWKVQKSKRHIMVNVGVDVWNYRPVTIESIIKAIENEETDVSKA